MLVHRLTVINTRPGWLWLQQDVLIGWSSTLSVTPDIRVCSQIQVNTEQCEVKSSTHWRSSATKHLPSTVTFTRWCVNLSHKAYSSWLSHSPPASAFNLSKCLLSNISTHYSTTNAHKSMNPVCGHTLSTEFRLPNHNCQYYACL